MVRFLSSTKLAIALCLILAAGGAAGSFLYEGNTAFGRAGSFNVFRSPVFLAPAALLIVNIVFCAIRRLAASPAGAPGTWTFAGIHLGLVLLAAGLLIDGLYGFVATQYFYPKVPASGYHNWRTGRDESFPFTVEVSKAEVRYHPLNLRIGLRDGAGNKTGPFTVREGTPVRAGGAIVVTPRRFDIAAKTLTFDAEAGGRSFTGLVAGPNGSAPVGGYTVVPLAYFNPEPAEFKVLARFTLPGRAPEDRMIRINDPATYSGIRFCFVGQDADRYGNPIVGLQMTREPGEPAFWAGGILFGISALAHFLLRARARGAQAAAALVAAVATSLAPCPVRALEPGAAAAERRATGVPGTRDAAGGGTVIAADTAWDGEVRIVAPVTVEKGATLRILAGTRVLLSGEDRDRDGRRDGFIQVFGRLIVEGERDRPVRFLPLSAGHPWEEIFLKDAEGAIRHAEFSGARWALHIHDGDVRVENALFRGNDGGTKMKGTGAAFARCTFRDNGVAIRFWDGGPAVMRSVIEGNGVGLFYRAGTGGGRFRGNRILNRDWNVKIGDWATGDLDLSDNYWGPGVGTGVVPLVQDYRDRKQAGRVRLAPALPSPPVDCGAESPVEEPR